MSRRIDVHTHIVPPFWREGMQDLNHNPGRYPAPSWSPDLALSFMDSQHIETGILSLTTPGIAKWEAEEIRAVARRVNDYNAELCIKHPGRFGTFATLPLPDIEGALIEAAYVLDELKVDGVVLYSNYDGTYLGHSSLDPLWAELDKREAVVFIHPGMLPLKEIEGTHAAFVDFPFDTTRTATDIVLKGVFERYKKVKVILSHGGGFLPYAAYRIGACASVPPGAPSLEEYIEMFRRFYFDTALASSSVTMRSLKAFAHPSHILFGSDYPYAPKTLAQDFTAMFDNNEVLTDQERQIINRDNATALLANWKP